MERWLQIRGFENEYEVSNLGNIRSKGTVQEGQNHASTGTGTETPSASAEHERGERVSPDDDARSDDAGSIFQSGFHTGADLEIRETRDDGGTIRERLFASTRGVCEAIRGTGETRQGERRCVVKGGVCDWLEVKVVQSNNSYPRVVISTNVCLFDNKIVKSIDTKKIQDALEKVVPEAVEFNEVQGDAHTAS